VTSRVRLTPKSAVASRTARRAGWALGPPGYLGHEGGTSGFRAMLGLRPPARRGAAVFVNDRAASGLPQAIRRLLDRDTGG
jgi:hypothetical protein